jgi:hypothetical protein
MFTAIATSFAHVCQLNLINHKKIGQNLQNGPNKDRKDSVNSVHSVKNS